MQHSLAIIGVGNMGAAIARGAIEAKALRPGDLIVADVDRDKLASVAAIGCTTTEDIAHAVKSAEQILLAVKPQSFASLAGTMRSATGARVVISIMAGLRSDSIREALGGQARVVRAMPNVACQIGAGMTGVCLGAGSLAGDERLAVALFASLGKTVMVQETLMHAVTAVSGSGPAYVFLLAEAMQQAAVHMGIAPNDAKFMVAQTILGAGKLLLESDRTAEELRQAVTSPGGTTAAALDVMNRGQLPRIVIDALHAARDRGRTLDMK